MESENLTNGNSIETLTNGETKEIKSGVNFILGGEPEILIEEAPDDDYPRGKYCVDVSVGLTYFFQYLYVIKF